MHSKIDHIGILVPNLGESVTLYRDVLGFEYIGEEDLPDEGVRVAMFKVGESRIELLEPYADNESLQRFLENRGSGIHHMAVAVEDIDKSLVELEANGAKLIDKKARPGAGGHRVAFLHPKGTSGVLLELCEAATPK